MENQTSTPTSPTLSTRRKIYYGVTVATVAALLTLPATAWQARMQLLPFTSPAQTAVVAEMRGDKSADVRLMAAQARRTPNDCNYSGIAKLVANRLASERIL